MVNVNDIDTTEIDLSTRYSEFKRVAGVFFGRKLAAFGFIVILILVLTAIFAPLLVPYDPNKMVLIDKLQHPNTQHLLGTDQYGRDTLSRIIYGARTSLTIGILAVAIGTLLGQLLGLFAGYIGGFVNAIIMRFVDTIMCIPPIIIALIIATALGGGMKNLIIALAVGAIPLQARLMCAMTLTVKQNDYILSSKVKGAGAVWIMFRHIIPNVFPPLLVAMTIELGTVILAEAGLSFLGVGINPPTAAWGSMVNEGYLYLFSNPIMSFAPGLAIMLVVLGFNMAGDGLRDALDPRLRGTFK